MILDQMIYDGILSDGEYVGPHPIDWAGFDPIPTRKEAMESEQSQDSQSDPWIVAMD